MKHQLNDNGNGCSCKEPFCKKWKDSFSTAGKEKRCPNCWTLLSIREISEGVRKYWCINCTITYADVV